MPEGYARDYPVPSFWEPVPVPVPNPGDLPGITVTINCQWLPVVRGALQQLTLPTTWQTLGADDLAVAIQKAATLIDLFQECPSGTVPFSCPYDVENGYPGWRLHDFSGLYTPTPLGVRGINGWDGTSSRYVPNTNDKTHGVCIELPISPPARITRCVVEFDLVKGAMPGAGLNNNSLTFWLAGASLVHNWQDIATTPDGVNQTMALDYGAGNVDLVTFFLLDEQTDGPDIPGSSRVTNMIVSGVGPPIC